jgi:hypothetical protein
MLHKDVYEIYKLTFDLGEIDTWWQNGYNSIRVRYENKREVIFTYENTTSWRLETVNKFIESMNKKH